MSHQFKKHYTRAEARAMLPRIQSWLDQLVTLQRQLTGHDEQLSVLVGGGMDAGGAMVNEWIKTLADIREVLREFEVREIQIKDLERGLVDFPAIHEGREVYLCWERGEEDIEFWHELDAGYAGRERL